MRVRLQDFFPVAVACGALASLLLVASVEAGGVFRGGAVGGVFIDAEGVVSTPEKGDNAQLLAAWQSGLDPVPGDLQKYTEQRFVSLRGIEQQLATAAERGEGVADSVRYMAGLLRVQHVLIYPPTAQHPEGDIVLAGPAEGWKVDSLGNTVGATTGRPVLMLEDLIVALRSSESANGNGISCSIDPTSDGLARVQQVSRGLERGVSPMVAARKLEQALGQQVITVSGVPATSHFARTLVAADFRMKRLAMDFEPAPIDGLPSYLQLIPERSTAVKNMLPRWWLATHYEPLRTDGEGLAWEIRGQGVKCLTEESIAAADGSLTTTGKASPFAQKWADLLTERFEELANHDSAFGHLRNAMDLAVAAAVISQEQAFKRVKLDAPQLTGKFEIEEYEAPRRVASQASFVRKGKRWIISASGGVQMYPWEIADKSEVSDSVTKVRDAAVAKANDSWWWQ